MSKISDAISDSFFWIFITWFTLIGILIRPFWFLFDRRRYVIKSNSWNKGFARFYCMTHYGLKDDAPCPNCGIPKNQLERRLNDE